MTTVQHILFHSRQQHSVRLAFLSVFFSMLLLSFMHTSFQSIIYKVSRSSSSQSVTDDPIIPSAHFCFVFDSNTDVQEEEETTTILTKLLTPCLRSRYFHVNVDTVSFSSSFYRRLAFLNVNSSIKYVVNCTHVVTVFISMPLRIRLWNLAIKSTVSSSSSSSSPSIEKPSQWLVNHGLYIARTIQKHAQNFISNRNATQNNRHQYIVSASNFTSDLRYLFNALECTRNLSSFSKSIYDRHNNMSLTMDAVNNVEHRILTEIVNSIGQNHVDDVRQQLEYTRLNFNQQTLEAVQILMARKRHAAVLHKTWIEFYEKMKSLFQKKLE